MAECRLQGIEPTRPPAPGDPSDERVPPWLRAHVKTLLESNREIALPSPSVLNTLMHARRDFLSTTLARFLATACA